MCDTADRHRKIFTEWLPEEFKSRAYQGSADVRKDR